MRNPGIFITGCPRSGTTLLQSIIATHSQIHSAPETSFFSRIIPRLGVEYSQPDRKIDPHCIKLVREDFSTMTGLNLPPDFAGSGTDISIRDLFERLMAFFNRDNKPLWAEKTTLHARNLLVIKCFFPDVKIVNLIRDPVACVGSMQAIRPTAFSDLRVRYLASLHEFSRLWNECVSAALEFPYKDQIIHVRYEALVENPADTVKGICEFLDVDFEQAMVGSFHHSAKDIFSESSCPWQKENLSEGISRKSLYRWRGRLGPIKTWLIQRYTLRNLTALGYYEENLHRNRFSLVTYYVLDQLVYIVSASKIELIFRKIFTRVAT